MRARTPTEVLRSLVTLILFIVVAWEIPANEPEEGVSQIIPIYAASGDQVEASVAHNSSANQFLVVWAPSGSSGGNAIIGQRVGSNGALIGGSFNISQGPGDASHPDVAYNSVADQFVVVWEYDDGIRPDIHSRTVSATGQLLNTEQDLGSGTGLTSRTRPAIAYGSVSQKYVVVFESYTQGSIGGHIEAQVLTNGGLLDGINIRIQTGGFSVHHTLPDIAFNRSRNEFLAVWQADVGDLDVYGRRIQGNGTPMSPETMVVNASAWDEGMPVVAGLPTTSNFGYYLVVSRIEDFGGVSNLWATRVTGQGSVEPGFYIMSDPEAQTRPAVAASEDTDQFLVVWTEPIGALSAVMGQRVTLEGSSAGPITVYNTENADNGAVAAGRGDTFMVVFDALVWPASSGRDIFGGVVNSEIFSDGFESGNTNAW